MKKKGLIVIGVLLAVILCMENENVLVRYQLRANYQARRGEKTGFWDIILVHQKPIPQVPKDMRP